MQLIKWFKYFLPVIILPLLVYGQVQRDRFEITPMSGTGSSRAPVTGATVYIVHVSTGDSLNLTEYSGTKAGTYYRANVLYGRYNIYVNGSLVKSNHPFGVDRTYEFIEYQDTDYDNKVEQIDDGVVGLNNFTAAAYTYIGAEGEVKNLPDDKSIKMNLDDSTLYVNPAWLDTAFHNITWVDTAHKATVGGVSRAIKTHIQNMNFINVKDFGALGDGETDDLSAIQAAIDTASTYTYGKKVYFPPGNYFISDSIVLKDGVTLFGIQGGMRDKPRIFRTDDGTVIDTPDDAISDAGIMGMVISGHLSSPTTSGSGIGIRFRDNMWGFIKDCFISGMAGQGILIEDGNAGIIENVLIYNTVLNRTQATWIGAIEIESAASDWRIRSCEIGTSCSIEDSMSTDNGYISALVIHSANCFVENCQLEISETGLYCDGNNNSFTSVRADLNYGNGFYNKGSNQFTGCRAVTNGRDTVNVYSGFFNYSGNAIFTGCMSYQVAGDTLKYHYYDYQESLTSWATWNECRWTGVPASSRAFGYSEQYGVSGGIYPGAFSFDNKMYSYSGGDTLDVNGKKYFFWDGSQDTTLNYFKNGITGQEIIIYCHDTDTLTIDHNTNMQMLEGVDLELIPKSIVHFRNWRGVWYQEGLKP
jgi:hypothetical protein